MSELIDYSSIRLSDFSIGGVTNLATGTISDIGSGTIINITFDSTGTTSTTPVVTYTQGTLTDLAGKFLASTAKTSTDTAVPRLKSARLFDVNGNGKIDRIIAYASETIQASNDITSWSLGSAIPGVSITAASVSGSGIILTLSEPTDFNTGTGSMTLSFSNNGSFKDANNNLMGNLGSPLSLIDSAKPILISKKTKDTSGNGKLDTILLSFSEDIQGGVASDFSVTGLATGSTFANAIAHSGNTLSLQINETSNITDTGITPSFVYSGSTVEDTENNTLSPLGSTLVDDGIAPKLLSKKTEDQNGNGYIDTIRFAWSENIRGTGGIIVNVNGYTVNSYSICSNGTDLCVGIGEKSIYDTDSTPSVQLTTNTTLEDLSNNTAPTEATASNSEDGVGPIIIGARYDAGATPSVSDDIIYATFSENFSGATINTANAATDFLLQ